MLADLVPLFLVILFLKVAFSFSIFRRNSPIIESDVKSLTLDIPIESNNYANNSYLNQSLKNLEYINQFENYLSCREGIEFSSEFLQNFNQLKLKAQLATLNNTEVLINRIRGAA